MDEKLIMLICDAYDQAKLDVCKKYKSNGFDYNPHYDLLVSMAVISQDCAHDYMVREAKRLLMERLKNCKEFFEKDSEAYANGCFCSALKDLNETGLGCTALQMAYQHDWGMSEESARPKFADYQGLLPVECHHTDEELDEIAGIITKLRKMDKEEGK